MLADVVGVSTIPIVWVVVVGEVGIVYCLIYDNSLVDTSTNYCFIFLFIGVHSLKNPIVPVASWKVNLNEIFTLHQGHELSIWSSFLNSECMLTTFLSPPWWITHLWYYGFLLHCDAKLLLPIVENWVKPRWNFPSRGQATLDHEVNIRSMEDMMQPEQPCGSRNPF